MVQPIKPADVVEAKKKYIPDFVIEAVNKCIAKHLYDGRAQFTVEEVVDLIVNTKYPPHRMTDMGGDTEALEFRRSLFTNRWLDIEAIYRANGWSVTFDRPAYNETYKAFWIFKAKS